MNNVRYNKYAWVLISLVLLGNRKLMIESLTFDDAHDANVDFSQSDKTYFNLKINENIPSATLFIIKDVDGTNTPRITLDSPNVCSAFSNSIDIFGNTDGTYKFLLKSPLDYEQSNCQEITASIQDDSGLCHFTLAVNNLDDNEPQLVFPSKCSLKENTIYQKSNTTCLLKMTDADGMMDVTKFSIITEESVVRESFEVDFLKKPDDDAKETIVAVFLKDRITLDFETKNLYVFSVKAQEEIQSNTVQAVVDVVDMPDQPPKWTKMFTTQQFEENLDQEFYVKAVDGDVQINNDISYGILNNACDTQSCQITIDNAGKISVSEVDREEVGDTLTFTIEATECDDSNRTSLDITFFILDQDDEEPRITIDNDSDNTVTIEKLENYAGTIATFSVQDMDLGVNGTYDIKLVVPKSSVNYPDAFQVIPTSGYQKGDFTLTVFNSTKLDYEDDDWKKITFELRAIEKADNSHVDSKSIVINLIDVNDEPPIFCDTTDTVSVPESITQGETIFNASAYDRDAGDVVSYQIMGVWDQKLHISRDGIITTKNDDVFDFEQLQQVVIQIRATDNGETHKTFKTLTINVIDVDDEPPSITVGRNRITVKENAESHTSIKNVEINVTDPDTKPKLKVEIDWTKSLITKNSALVVNAQDNQWQCFDLTTDNHEENSQKIIAHLWINKLCSPDFELFDAITIFLIATDENTVKRDKSVTGSILVNIEDVNDNPPEFIESSLKDLEVTDGTAGIAKIGTISAHDVDLNDNIRFSINAEDSEADWVDIDEKTGLLSVKEGVIIDDDIPPRSSILYNITACDNDNVHCPQTTVNISLKDINNQNPQILDKTEQKHLEEKSSTGTDVLQLSFEDKDRDLPFHTVVSKFDTNITNEAANCFDISEDGKISVNLRYGCILDRDNGATTYTLPILAYDNPKGTLQLTDRFDLKIILDDINDNTPRIVNKSIECSESLKKNDKLTSSPILAEDPDEGDNAKVSFEIKDVTPLSRQNPKILTKSSLKISTDDYKTATITVQCDLEGYYGKYNVTIQTSDHGTPSRSQNNIIELTITKFNFMAPIFKFPGSDNMKIVLQKDQVPSSNLPLKLYNDTDLRDLEVDDQQSHKWDVSYEVTDENGQASNLFSTIKSSGWKAKLQLMRIPNDDDAKHEHSITIEAKVKNDQQEGEKTISVSTHMKISFFSSEEQPVFKDKSCTISFDENTVPGTPQEIKNAAFPSGLEIQPYYSLLDNTDTFQVNSTNGDVSLKVAVDFEKTPSFEIQVGASSSVSPEHEPEGDSVLNVHVEIIDLNDHIPEFFPSKFVGAFLKSYSKESTIVTVNATDGDPRDLGQLKFSMGDVECIGNLQPPNPPFHTGEVDGKVTPTFKVTSDMSGYCIFEVTVTDTPDKYNTQHTVNTSVQINIVSDEELVAFTFLNDDTYINQEQEYITDAICEIFKSYNYKCYLADLNYNPDGMNTTADFFFLDQNMTPIKGSEILGNLSDIDKYTSLRKSLLTLKVYLGNFSPPEEQEVEDHLKIWLFATTFVLATLLMLLSIVFFFRNRALTQRINNLSTTKFGSQESGLNRAGVAAPTTNRNAMEGSNPVFHSENFVKEIEPDQNSIISSDSDLYGVEDNPEFDSHDVDI